MKNAYYLKCIQTANQQPNKNNQQDQSDIESNNTMIKSPKQFLILLKLEKVDFRIIWENSPSDGVDISERGVVASSVTVDDIIRTGGCKYFSQ